MHELALARTIVEQVVSVANRESLERVSRVAVGLGEVAGVDAEALRLGFEVASRGSVAEGAVLDIEDLPNCADLRVAEIEGCPRE